MKTLRIAQAALAMTLAMGINSTTHAFMAVTPDQPADVQVTLAQTVEALRQEITAGETKCEDMLVKLNEVLADIDAKLDAGIENESEYLAAREAVAEMRYDLECLAQKLTQELGAPIVGGGTPIIDGGFAPAGGNTIVSGGGGFVGGGGSSGHGGHLKHLLVAGGIATAIAVPLATDSDDNGPIASGSTATP